MENKKVKVVTHDGLFHGDEVLAVAMLCLLVGSKNIQLVRSRDPRQFNDAQYILDVGEKYEPTKGHYDHHQKSFDLTRYGVPYATAGLFWKDYGPIIVKTLNQGEKFTEQTILRISNKVDKNLIQSVDAHDTGYRRPNELSVNGISGFNMPDVNSPEQSEAFMLAVNWVTPVVINAVKKASRDVKEEMEISNLFRGVDLKGETVLYLPKFMNWYQFIKNYPDIERVVIPGRERKELDLSNFSERYKKMDKGLFPNDMPYKVQVVQGHDMFPDSWRGLSGEELQKLTGVRGATFCHPAGFLVGVDSFTAVEELLDRE